MTRTSATNLTKKRWHWPGQMRMRENITGYLFISPAMLIIAVFGLFPIGYAIYMSLYRWRVTRGQFKGIENYHEIIGDWDGLAITLVGFFILYIAYWLWMNALNPKSKSWQPPLPVLTVLAILPFIGLAYIFLRAGMINVMTRLMVMAEMDSSLVIEAGSVASASIVVGLVLLVLGLLVLPAMFWVWRRFVTNEDDQHMLIRLCVAFLFIAVSFGVIAFGWDKMTGAAKDTRFLDGMVITFYYAFSSVPLQLGLGLLLAYVLYQKIHGKELFRMLFFLPYVTPAVAAAVVFRTVFSPRDYSLANQVIGWMGIEPQRWLSEPAPFLNALFGWNLGGFAAGPSMALMAIVIYGIWTYTGYNAVIFLAGLGSIPGDLYEAARVDGANQWYQFRYITIPLLSPITFYLSVLAFIGTFKAFNHVYVMRTPQSLGTVDAASIVIFDSFRTNREYGLATAQAIVLFLIILAITQVQRNVLEKRVFYG